MKIRVFGETNVGKIRENNEDNFLILDIHSDKTGNIESPISTEEGIYLVVADGMGGAAAGETAALIVIESSRDACLQYNASVEPKEIPLYSVALAQRNCLDTVRKKPEFMGMGSVATFAFIKDETVYISQVGDTRLYLYRNKTLEQITEDQNFVTELVKLGIITEEQAQFHPQRNAVTQAIGAVDEITPVMHEFPLEIGDKILICSDGLSGMLTDIEVQLILDSSQNISDIVNILIDTANANGGHDNITVIVAEITN